MRRAAASRRRGARRGPPPARRPAAAPRPPDRVPAPDPGRPRPPVRRPPPGAGRGAAPRPGRGLGGRHLLRAFRRGEGGRDPAAAADRPGLRLALLRARRRRRRCAPRSRPGSTRPRCGWCARPAWAAATPRPIAEVGHFHVDHATPAAVTRGDRRAAGTHPVIPAYETFAAYLRRRRLRGARGAPRRRARRRTRSQETLLAAGLRGLGGAGFPAGRKWRFVRGRAGAALSRGQRRRGRARHLQGPLLPRAHART